MATYTEILTGSTMTGWPSTGCAWTRRGRPCWRPSWGRWPRRSRARSTARTCATSDQRRADALVEVCRRAAAAGGAAPATAKAAVAATMGYQDLLDRTGAGTTPTGSGPPRDRPQDGLRRRDHPGRPRRQAPGPRPGPDHQAGHRQAVPGPEPARPGLHLPRLLTPTRLVSRTPRSPGLTAARPTRRTWPCSAHGTTPSSTSAATPPPSPPSGWPGTCSRPAPRPPHAAGRGSLPAHWRTSV